VLGWCWVDCSQFPSYRKSTLVVQGHCLRDNYKDPGSGCSNHIYCSGHLVAVKLMLPSLPIFNLWVLHTIDYIIIDFSYIPNHIRCHCVFCVVEYYEEIISFMTLVKLQLTAFFFFTEFNYIFFKIRDYLLLLIIFLFSIDHDFSILYFHWCYH
jgi:hypothetical protein